MMRAAPHSASPAPNPPDGLLPLPQNRTPHPDTTGCPAATALMPMGDPEVPRWCVTYKQGKSDQRHGCYGRVALNEIITTVRSFSSFFTFLRNGLGRAEHCASSFFCLWNGLGHAKLCEPASKRAQSGHHHGGWPQWSLEHPCPGHNVGLTGIAAATG